MQMRDFGLFEAVAVVLIFGLYFLPSLIAFFKQHRSSLAIFLLNFLLGWTIIVWIKALLWSIRKNRPFKTCYYEKLDSATKSQLNG